jgi:hypothetical protein
VGDAAHLASGCVDDGVHAPFWSETTQPNDPCQPVAGTPLPGTDAGACEARPPMACDVTDGHTQQGSLNEQIVELVAACHGAWSGESGIEVWFRDGCATSLSYFGLAGLDAACVTDRLDAVRWQCAVGLGCGGWGISSLP